MMSEVGTLLTLGTIMHPQRDRHGDLRRLDKTVWSSEYIDEDKSSITKCTHVGCVISRPILHSRWTCLEISG